MKKGINLKYLNKALNNYYLMKQAQAAGKGYKRYKQLYLENLEEAATDSVKQEKELKTVIESKEAENSTKPIWDYLMER